MRCPAHRRRAFPRGQEGHAGRIPAYDGRACECRPRAGSLQLPDVDRGIGAALRLGPGSWQAKHRTWSVSDPRMIAMFLPRKHTSAAYSENAQNFGGRNHSTAAAADKKTRLWLQTD